MPFSSSCEHARLSMKLFISIAGYTLQISQMLVTEKSSAARRDIKNFKLCVCNMSGLLPKENPIPGGASRYFWHIVVLVRSADIVPVFTTLENITTHKIYRERERETTISTHYKNIVFTMNMLRQPASIKCTI